MRGSLTPARLLAAALMALVFALAVASSALATSTTSTANGLSVAAALTPDSVSGAQTVLQSESVKNVTNSTMNVAIRVIGPRPSSAPVTIDVTLPPNATFSQSATFPASVLSKGSHALIVAAVNRQTGAGAGATASVTVN